MKRKYTTIVSLIAAPLIITMALGVFYLGVTSGKINLGLPSISRLEDYTPIQATKIYDKNDVLITELFTERRTITQLKDIPVDLQNAVLSIEDDNFFRHWGISPIGIVRAALSNVLKRRKAQGGSTITQQLAKTIFLSPEKKFSRKIKEVILTLQLERYYSKEEILQLYLNQIYFGSGAYGIEAASRIYFAKHISELNLAECAMLAGLPRSPNKYSPFKNLQNAQNRRATVLTRMRELKYITPEQEKAANAQKILSQSVSVPSSVAPYFVEFVRTQLEPKYGKMLYQGGLSIYTTLDLKAQNAAEKAISDHLSAFDIERKIDFETAKSSPIPTQCGLIALDPKTGGIVAMVGGRNFLESQFNRTMQARRQPGSSFKPIVYTAALENGYTPTSILTDKPMFFLNDGRDWKLESRNEDFAKSQSTETLKDPMKYWHPKNYENKYYEKVLLRSALEHSLNACSIELLMAIGPQRAIEYARKLGISTSLTNTLSLALGSSDVTLIELTGAFGVFANNGILAEPYAVERVQDKDGKILEEHTPKEESVLSAQSAYIMTNLLKGVVQHGTGMGALALNRPCAGKTGTTNDFTDAWFVGYTPQIVAGVWVGYDDRSIQLGSKNTGGRISCPIWTDFMREALRGEPKVDFTPPSDVVFKLIDPATGLLAFESTPGAYLEAFIKGTEPKDYYMNNTQKASVFGKDGKVEKVTSIEEDAGGF